MEASLKRKWIEALRSGRYKQGRLHLRNRDEFCCLGVLCDVSGQGQWKLGDYKGAYCYYKEEESEFYHLPPFFSGIGARTVEDLMRLNDIEKLSFPEIAEWIKTNIPEDDQ